MVGYVDFASASIRLLQDDFAVFFLEEVVSLHQLLIGDII